MTSGCACCSQSGSHSRKRGNAWGHTGMTLEGTLTNRLKETENFSPYSDLGTNLNIFAPLLLSREATQANRNARESQDPRSQDHGPCGGAQHKSASLHWLYLALSEGRSLHSKGVRARCSHSEGAAEGRTPSPLPLHGCDQTRKCSETAVQAHTTALAPGQAWD